MRNRFNNTFIVALAAGLWLFGAACDDEKTCPTGTPGCDCFPNDTCMAGLSCGANARCAQAGTCAEDTYCAALHRRCTEADDVVTCGDCLTGFDEVDGICVSGGLCEPNTCSGHGQCDDSSGAAVCTCLHGYAGGGCDICDETLGYHWNTMGTACTADSCDPDPCIGEPGRRCDGVTGTCVCEEGYCTIGDLCVAPGEADPEHGCQICDPGLDPQTWTLQPAEAVCRAALNDCDLEEKCDGASNSCPADLIKAEGSACGDPDDTACDGADTCDSTGFCQPNYQPVTTECREMAGACDLADTCNGQGICPDQYRVGGVACDDGDPCTAEETCTGLGPATAQCMGTAYDCNGHGTCNASDDLCGCDTGYTSDYCTVCAVDYQDNDGNGTCYPTCNHPAAPVCSGGYQSCNDASGTASCWSAGFIGIPGGTFFLGSPASETGHESDEARHEVTILGGFEVQITEVTQAQWRAVAQVEAAGWGEDPSYNPGCDDCPVDSVSWYGAIAFANAMSRQAGVEECYILQECAGTPGSGCSGSSCDGDYFCTVRPRRRDSVYRCSGYRLPTEAEWEYFARAGSDTPFHPSQGNTGLLSDPDCADPNLAQIGWYCGNAQSTQLTGGRSANDWGFYDVSGNVWEWTWDVYQADYETDKTANPQGPAGGNTRVIRGGGFADTAVRCRSAARFDAAPTERSRLIGLRLVRSLDPDGDGVDTVYDNCPYHYNPDQGDYDDDGDGDPCNTWQIVRAGTFIMGTPDGVTCPPDNPGCTVVPLVEPHRTSAEVQHLVTLTRDFELMTYEVTQQKWRDLVNQSGAPLDPDPSNYPACGDTCPVDSIPFVQSLRWANTMSRQDNLPECYDTDHCGNTVCAIRLNNYATIYDCPGYRLPTEAEWEYAARAGSQTPYYPSQSQDGSIQTSDPTNILDPNLDQIAYYGLNAVVTYDGGYQCPWAQGLLCGANPVGGKEPNAWGLYDLLGNGLEFVWDQIHTEFDGLPEVDPEYSPTELRYAHERVSNRGGGYFLPANWTRCGARGAGMFWNLATTSTIIGFRLARTLDADGDGFEAYADVCPGISDPQQTDSDGDGVGDACDNCVTVANPAQTNSDAGRLVAPIAAVASSAAGVVNYAAVGALAESCTGDEDIDCLTAWKPSGTGSGAEWIELTFPATTARGIRIKEWQVSGGFVTQIEVMPEGQSTYQPVAWTGDDNADWDRYGGSPWLRVDWHQATPFRIQKVRVHTQTLGSEQIDAVLLVADDGEGDACDQDTYQSFEGGTTPYVLTQHGNAPGPSLESEGDNHFVRMTLGGVGGQRGVVTFDRTAPGTPQQIVADFDFRITPTSGGADGMAVALLSTALHGTTGAGPSFGQAPNITGTLGVGFDTFDNGELLGGNFVSIHFDGAQVGVNLDPGFTLENSLWNHALLVLTEAPGGFTVDLWLTPAGALPVAVVTDLLVTAPLYESRIAFSGATGGLTSSHDIDNVQVQYR